MGQEIDPLVFLWRTGFWDTIGAVLRRALGERQHDRRSARAPTSCLTGSTTASNRRRERKAASCTGTTKRTALRATSLADGGVRLTLDRVARLVQRNPAVEVHLIEYSAGAILRPRRRSC